MVSLRAVTAADEDRTREEGERGRTLLRLFGLFFLLRHNQGA